MGSRDPKNDKLTAWIAANGENASGGTFADAAQFGKVIVLATVWSGTENAIRLADPKNFVEKIVIDAPTRSSFQTAHRRRNLRLDGRIPAASKCNVGY